MPGDWSDEENDTIVADYFEMLADDIPGRPYNKARHNRMLQTVIDRPRTSCNGHAPRPEREPDGAP